MQTHRLYGLNLASDFPFAHRLAEGHGAADLTVREVRRPAVLEGRGSRLYSSPLAHLDRFPGAEVLRFPGTADFYLEPSRIRGHLLDPGSRDLMELRLLGAVLSYWLERLGIPALHASAVRLDAGAVGFVAPPGVGKSSLAAALVQAGAALLTDDVLPVEELEGHFLARPGYPEMRLEPDAAGRLGPVAGLAPISPGDSKLHVPVDAFCDAATPLAALYVIERRPGPPEILPLPRSEAVIELVRHSFVPQLAEAAGLQPRRLDLFARLVRQVPVHRLLCPTGLENLPRIADAIVKNPLARNP